MEHPSSARVRVVLRRLRALGARRRRRPMPRQQQPDAIRLSYFRALVPVVDAAAAAIRQIHGEISHLLMVERHERGKMDTDRRAEARRLVDRAARAFADKLDGEELKRVAREMGRRTSDFQKAQFDRQVRAAMGVPFSALEAPVRERIEEFAARNVDLIKTVPDRYFDRIRLDVEEAFEKGTHPEDLAEDFADRYDIAIDDARRIARDQIGKLNAQVNQTRQESIGVVGYVWRTMRDNRVREEHEERDGEHFRWDDPPEDGHPGEPIQCRCYAEPDFGPVLQGLQGAPADKPDDEE